MTRQEIVRTAISQLNGLKFAVMGYSVVQMDVIDDFHRILRDVEGATGIVMHPYYLSNSAIQDPGHGRGWCRAQSFASKLQQAVAMLEAQAAPPDAAMVVVGTVYNSLRDTELKARCSDLLSAADHFDRAINQATLILEDRIRKKAGGTSDQTGVTLVNELIKSDPAKTVLWVSDDRNEQEGFANLCRGIMLAFRNQTHHTLTDKFTREDALKVCTFIDLCLRTVDNATIISGNRRS